MEHVLQGIRVAHGEDPEAGPGLRVWLGGVTWSEVEVHELTTDKLS